MSREVDDEAVADTLQGDTLTGPGATAGAGAAPQSVGRYQLLEPLGAGGMGAVYRARDPDLNRDVAVKLLNTAAGASAELQRRLLREAQAMAKLSHGNLAVVYDVGADAGRVFIAMELIEGANLKDWLARTDGDWRERLAVVIAAAKGLAAAHNAGVVHRDFKPANVLVGDTGAVKVVDFGLARGVGDLSTAADAPAREPRDVLSTPMTVTGAVMGTPAYMAPEQHRGEQVDERADQFALGVVAYEALYGRRPFDGATLAELAESASAGPGDAPDGDVPSALFPVVARALAPSPDDRHASVAAFIDALEARARPPSRRGLAIAVAVTVAALATGAVVYRQTRSEPERHGELPREAIVEVVRHNHESIRECHRRELERNPDLPAGRVSVTFFIAEDGRVRRTEVDDSQSPSPELASCVGAASLQWRFPPPEGGPVEVSYPFDFGP